MKKSKFNDGTTPAILRFKYDDSTQWKVSPFGPDDPDRDATWCDSKEEALQLCEELSQVKGGAQ